MTSVLVVAAVLLAVAVLYVRSWWVDHVDTPEHRRVLEALDQYEAANGATVALLDVHECSLNELNALEDARRDAVAAGDAAVADQCAAQLREGWAMYDLRAEEIRRRSSEAARCRKLTDRAFEDRDSRGADRR